MFEILAQGAVTLVIWYKVIPYIFSTNESK